MKQKLQTALAVAFWLLVWQAAAMALGKDVLLVTPLTVLRVLAQQLPTAAFWRRVGFSALRIFTGFVLALTAGVLLAALSHQFGAVRALLAPVMQLVQAMPVASFVILALLWVRSRNLSIVVSFTHVLPVIYSSVQAGIDNTDLQLLEMARVFRVPLARRLRYIWLPGAFPSFVQGCAVAIGMCWKSGVSAEVIGQPSGSIGDALYRAKITLSTGDVFAWTLVIIVISVLFQKALLYLLRRAAVRLSGEVRPCP